jgi:hypothetical protein
MKSTVYSSTTFAQLEAQALVVVQVFPAGGQARLQLQVGAAHRQAVVQVAAHGTPEGHEGVDRIPASRVLVDGHAERARGMRGREDGGHRAAQRQGQGGGGEGGA